MKPRVFSSSVTWLHLCFSVLFKSNFSFLQGFEPRGTSLSNEIVAFSNLHDALYEKRTLVTRISSYSRPVGGPVMHDNVHTATRKRRSLQSSLQPPMNEYLNGYYASSMSFVFKAADPDKNLFEADKLKAICSMDTDIVRNNPSFLSNCQRYITECYSSSSLGNYVALLNNRQTCQNITEDDVQNVKILLQNCSSHFVKQTLTAECSLMNETFSSNCKSVPPQCIKHSAVYIIFQYLVDNEFVTSNNAFLKYTLSIPQVYRAYDFYDEMYGNLKGNTYEKNGVKLAAFRFGNFKYDKFGKELIAEVIFPALAMIVVFAIMWFFLGSFILTFCALFCVIYACGLSYFLYNIAFGMDFFPFLNVLTLVFLVGIGADDAFVYYDIWRQTRAANPNANIMQLTLKTLRYSALSMLVTSLTTASAFFAGISSSITAIKCFGIFAGTSILTNYLLMITYFPAVVALHEKWVMKYNEGHELHTLKSGQSEEDITAPMPQDMSTDALREGPLKPDNQKQSSFCILQVFDFPCSLVSSAADGIQKFSSNLFGRWLPYVVIKFHWVWVVLLVCLTAGFLCVNFVKPGLQLPESKDFQVFASSHSLEQYSLKYKSFFRFEQSGSSSIELIWGVKPADNGNYFNPDDKGTLEFESNWDDIFTPKGQQFLLSLCESAKNQSFFRAFGGNRGCPINALKTLFKSGSVPNCSSHSFPYPRDVTKRCLLGYAMSGHETGLLFDSKTNDVKGFRLVIFTNQPFTNAFSVVDGLYKQVTSWLKDELSEAPPGLQSGWVGSWLFNFYGLQIGLSQGTYSSLGISVAVSFFVMLLTTLNIFISIYAIITIIGIISITIGSLVLAGWQLNILESIVMSVAVGLSIDFTMHYGVAYRLAPDKNQRESRVRYSLVHIGSAITMAALTTFLTGETFCSCFLWLVHKLKLE